MTDRLINRPIAPAVVTTHAGHEVSVHTEVRTWSAWDHVAEKVTGGLEPECISVTGSHSLDPNDARELARLLLNAANRVEPSIGAMRAAQILASEYEHASRDDQPDWVQECR